MQKTDRKITLFNNQRLDLAYSVQMLSQFMDKPTQTHLDFAHHVLRYLKGKPG